MGKYLSYIFLQVGLIGPGVGTEARNRVGSGSGDGGQEWSGEEREWGRRPGIEWGAGVGTEARNRVGSGDGGVGTEDGIRGKTDGGDERVTELAGRVAKY